MSGRQLAWCATPPRRRETSLRRRTGGGLQGKGNPTQNGSGIGMSVRSAVTAGSRLPAESSDELTWESGGAKMPVENPDRGQGSPVIPDVLSGKGGTVEMPRGEVLWETGDEDYDAGAICAPACPRHRGESGGRKLPPPTVPQVRHAGPPSGAEWESPGDRAVCKRSEEEETAADRDKYEGELGVGF